MEKTHPTWVNNYCSTCICINYGKSSINKNTFRNMNLRNHRNQLQNHSCRARGNSWSIWGNTYRPSQHRCQKHSTHIANNSSEGTVDTCFLWLGIVMSLAYSNIVRVLFGQAHLNLTIANGNTVLSIGCNVIRLLLDNPLIQSCAKLRTKQKYCRNQIRPE